MPQHQMTFWIALYGALLSTLLFIRSLSEGWPRLILQRRGDDVLVSVKNEGKHSLIIHRISVLYGGIEIDPCSWPTARHTVRAICNESYHGDWQIVVPPDGNQDFRININKPRRYSFCLLFWNSARLRIWPRLPMPFVISQKRLGALKRSEP